MSYQIVTDSSCNLTEVLIDELELEILPLTFMVDGVQHQSYLKGETTDLKQFYTMMREGKVITTSLPNLSNSEKLLTDILKSGKDILYLGFSSSLSGTYNSITVDDLMFLYRGGRVSRTAAFAGSMLKIKPVMHVDNEGHLIPLEKKRGRKKSIQGLVEHMEATANAPVADQVVGISHGDCIEDVEYLQSLITKKFGVTKYLVNYVDPVIGAHSGPGTLALFFLASER